MTDNEIIKSLESASEWFAEHGRNTNTAIIEICRESIDLIKRQKAEIERLKEPLQKLSEIGYCHNYQLERSDLVSWIYDVCSVIKAVKEMTED